MLNILKKNDTKDQKVDEGTFSMYFSEGDSENQNGFFGTLFPTESNERTYTFEILKSQKPTYIEYKSNTFNNSSGSDSFKWKVE